MNEVVIEGHEGGMVLVVARNPRRIAFESATDLTRHFNAWSAVGLTTPEQWADALVATRQWLDYSARNQVLLASYGIDGPVAGQETWRLVPSTSEGGPCAVRAGEHGWPVRVPITTGGSEPDPYLGGSRPSRSRTERFEWRPVFAIDQLARRPQPDSLVPIELPEQLLGRRADRVFAEAVHKVARTTVRGRLPASADAHQLLADTAIRLSRDAKGPPLDPALGEQVAWLVADRVGHAQGELPTFDPEVLEPRDRWQRLQAVLDPARKLTAALGVVVGVDLTSSPLPKMEIVDDRAVPVERRRRLPAASLERLQVGTWQEVGPYSADEWAARGETGSGRGAYLRLNRSAYLVAIENGTEAAWRLEDVPERKCRASLSARAFADTRELARRRAGPALGPGSLSTARLGCDRGTHLPPQPRPSVNAVAISPTGRAVATAGDGSGIFRQRFPIRLWTPMGRSAWPRSSGRGRSLVQRHRKKLSSPEAARAAGAPHGQPASSSTNGGTACDA